MIPKENAPQAAPSPETVARLLLGWFNPNRRSLPWRASFDSYAIWISEVMLQQTTVGYAVTRFSRWMERFPTLNSLARASEQEVLYEWEGLGYYSRARNLGLAAQKVLAEFSGVLPADYRALRSLPGIGDYTASAILAIAFDQPVPALDVNVRRILNRLVFPPNTDNTSVSDLRAFLEQALTGSSPRLLTEALMEFGQIVCLARSPLCTECPLKSLCRSAGTEFVNQSSSIKSARINRRSEIAIVAESNGAILVRNSQQELFRGMWLLPTIDGAEDWETAVNTWSQSAGLTVSNKRKFKQFRHYYTTNVITLSPVHLVVTEPLLRQHEEFKWIPKTALNDYPMPSAHRRIIAFLKTNYQKPFPD